MTNLEDFLGKKYDPFGLVKKKKPKKIDSKGYIINSDTSLSGEDERLKQKYRDLGIDLRTDLDREKEEYSSILLRITPKEKPEEKENLRDLGISTGLLSGYLRLNKPIEKNKIKEYKENIIIKKENFFNFEEKIKDFDYNEINEKIINYSIPNIISKNFSKIQSSPLGLNLTLAGSASITADNIGKFALPIVEYIQQKQPDYVVANDRGARLLGLAVFRLYNKLYGRFPTADGTIRFRRFSKSNTQEATEQHVQPLVEEMLAYKKKPTVLVLDDWVCSGGTKRLAQNVFDKLGKGRIKTKFGVLVGGGADVSGHSEQTSGFAGVTDWRDDSDIIGIRYSDGDYDNNWVSIGISAQPVRSEQARNYRIRMYKGIDKLVKKITKKENEPVLAEH